MNFNSYIVSDTKTAFSLPVSNQRLTIKKSFKQKAFTLAETLITLSIIGVVAAMTVPTLMTNANNQGYVTGLKKAYSNLTNTMKTISMEMGCGNDFSCVVADGDSTYFGESLASQFKTAYKTVSADSSTGNFITFGKGENEFNVYPNNGYFTTPDGITFGIHMPLNFGQHNWAGIILVDVNGVEKGPNKWGKDAYAFQIASRDQNGIKAGTVLPYGSKMHANYHGDDSYYWGNRANIKTAHFYKSGKVFETGKIDDK